LKPLTLTTLGIGTLLASTGCTAPDKESAPPNIILIMTDDQGYGDLGFTGNPHINTPVIDGLAQESIRFNNFYVSPVCAPTRASLLTGRYSLRTGIRDTYNGGALMASDEVTLAEILKQAGYSTGVFGKWHLGDNYPFRPNDQGFDESLIHLAGGMGQVGDITTFFKGDSSYFDPVLWQNGRQKAFTGYCSDIFARQAIDFIEQNSTAPFFCFLSFNAPHTPLQVPDEYFQKYKDIDPSSGFEDSEIPEMSERNKEDARKIYAMVENIDVNVGRLLDKLDELQITDNTIVIFMSDNGPQQPRYNAGMRGLKSSVYRGGVRVPFYFRYPALGRNKDVEATAAHIDIMPTLAHIADAVLPDDRVIDGISLLPMIRGEQADRGDRPLFFYWTRRYPELYNNISLQKGRYKLVGHADYNAPVESFELFNIENDPFEQYNIVSGKKDIAESLKAELDEIYNELINSDNLVNPPRIIVGSEHENPVILSRNDAEGQRGIWAQEEIYGKWRVTVTEGYYNIRFKFITPVEGNGRMILEQNTIINQMRNEGGPTDVIEMKNVHLTGMDCHLIPFYSVGSRNILPLYIEMEKLDL
jgi:arylsulfatase A-like enzyme